jgi:hypothetical protein
MPVIDSAYAEGVQITAADIVRAGRRLFQLAEEAKTLLFKEEAGDITITEEQRTALFAEYAARKQAIVDAYSLLP